jgi:threonine dehydratase
LNVNRDSIGINVLLSNSRWILLISPNLDHAIFQSEINSSSDRSRLCISVRQLPNAGRRPFLIDIPFPIDRMAFGRRENMVGLSEVQLARQRLEGRVNRTEVTPDPTLGEQLGTEVCLKWESQQITGAFKVRGALNTVLSVPEKRREAGVVASSSGNHGLGVSYAAKQADIPAIVYVPDYASQKKIAAMRELGAEVRVVDGGYSPAEEAAVRLAEERSAVFISPYGHPDVIAGQGTIILEWLEQTRDLDTVVLPVGGGGLGSGIGLALKALRPTSHLIGVQTEGSAFLHENWHGRSMETVEVLPNLAEGLSGRVDPQSITLSLTRRLFDDFLLVNDDEIARAVAYCYETHGEKVEGAAAVGLAALLAGKMGNLGRSVGVLITGGNISPDQHRDILDRVGA